MVSALMANGGKWCQVIANDGKLRLATYANTVFPEK